MSGHHNSKKEKQIYTTHTYKHIYVERNSTSSHEYEIVSIWQFPFWWNWCVAWTIPDDQFHFRFIWIYIIYAQLANWNSYSLTLDTYKMVHNQQDFRQMYSVVLHKRQEMIAVCHVLTNNQKIHHVLVVLLCSTDDRTDNTGERQTCVHVPTAKERMWRKTGQREQWDKIGKKNI